MQQSQFAMQKDNISSQKNSVHGWLGASPMFITHKVKTVSLWGHVTKYDSAKKTVTEYSSEY